MLQQGKYQVLVFKRIFTILVSTICQFCQLCQLCHPVTRIENISIYFLFQPRRLHNSLRLLQPVNFRPMIGLSPALKPNCQFGLTTALCGFPPRTEVVPIHKSIPKLYSESTPLTCCTKTTAWHTVGPSHQKSSSSELQGVKLGII